MPTKFEEALARTLNQFVGKDLSQDNTLARTQSGSNYEFDDLLAQLNGVLDPSQHAQTTPILNKFMQERNELRMRNRPSLQPSGGVRPEEELVARYTTQLSPFLLKPR